MSLVTLITDLKHTNELLTEIRDSLREIALMLVPPVKYEFVESTNGPDISISVTGEEYDERRKLERELAISIGMDPNHPRFQELVSQMRDDLTSPRMEPTVDANGQIIVSPVEGFTQDQATAIIKQAFAEASGHPANPKRPSKTS